MIWWQIKAVRPRCRWQEQIGFSELKWFANFARKNRRSVASVHLRWRFRAETPFSVGQNEKVSSSSSRLSFRLFWWCFCGALILFVALESLLNAFSSILFFFLLLYVNYLYSCLGFKKYDVLQLVHEIFVQFHIILLTNSK